MATKKKPAGKSPAKTAKRPAKSPAKPAARAAAKTSAKAAAKPSAKTSAAKAKRPASRMTRKKPETLRLASAAPSLTVNDVEKTLAFYRDVLGFTVTDRWEEGGKLFGLMLLAGDVSVYVSQDDWKKGKDRQKGEGFRVYCATLQDVDVLASQMKKAGATLDQEPADMEWGRHFSVTDPDGFKYTFVNEKKR